MASIKTKKYTVSPSDNRDWIIIKSPKGLKIDVEIRILDYHYDCVPKEIEIDGKKLNCSQLCCYTGCYVSPAEIKYTANFIEEVKPLLQDDALKVLRDQNNEFHVPDDFDEEEDLYKTRCAPEEWQYDDDDEDDESDDDLDEDELDEEDSDEIEEDDMEEVQFEVPKNHCLFLMKNGLCSLHALYNDKGIDWVKNKFNICVTFPIDIRPQDKTLAFMSDFDSFTYGKVDCISSDEELKKSLGMPQIVDSMKYAIVDRYGEEWWAALDACAKDYREGKVSIAHIYKDVDLD